MGQVRHVFAVVGFVGKLADVFAVDLAQPQFQAFGQDVHLVAGVIDVKFPGGIEADLFHDAVEGVPVGGGPGADDVQRPGGIGADKFQQHLLPLPVFGIAKFGAQFVDVPKRLLIKRRGDLKIDEARPGYSDALEILVLDEFLQEFLRQFLGGGLVLFGQDHGGVGGIVPVFGIVGHLDREFLVVAEFQRVQSLGDMVMYNAFDHIAVSSALSPASSANNRSIL